MAGSTENRAREFAIAAHGEQRYGDDPYVSHLAAVVQVMDDFELSDEFKVAGWLHDGPCQTKCTGW